MNVAPENAVHFYVDIKSIVPEAPPVGDQVPIFSLRDKIKPKGDFYFYNPNIELKDDDWVIYGVASTDDVDLVNDVIDVKEVFGDYLEEFARVGKIFYEHGYRFASQANKDNRIDEPIGYPYLVEIFDNKLWIYAILDKSHPLAQKVWESMTGTTDPRFSKKWGFSIGALRVGIGSTMSDPRYGTIKKAPKMRLYEISVTPQPVNPYTWAEVVKSLVANVSTEKKEFKQETVPDSPEKLQDTPDVEFGDAEAAGSPKAEREEMEDAVEMKAVGAEEEDEKKEDEAEEAAAEEPASEEQEKAEEAAEKLNEMAESLEGGEEKGEEAEETEEEKTDEGAEEAKEEAKEENGEEGNVLLDLLGGEEGEGESKADEEDEGGDAAIDLIADKLDMLSETVEQLIEKVNKIQDALISQEEAPVEKPSPASPASELVTEKALSEKLDEALDKMDLTAADVAEIKKTIKSLEQHIAEVESELSVVKSMWIDKEVKEESVNVEEARKNFDPNAAVTKSVNTAEGEVTVVEERHPGMKDVTSELEATDPITKAISDPDLRESLAEVVEIYKSLGQAFNKGEISQAEYTKKVRTIYATVREVFGLDPNIFVKLAK